MAAWASLTSRLGLVHLGLVDPVAGVDLVQGLLGDGAALKQASVAGLIEVGRSQNWPPPRPVLARGGDLDVILGQFLAQAAQVAFVLGHRHLIVLGLEGQPGPGRA